MQPPQKDEIQLVVFGRGVGECILLHLGSNKWVIVDSFRLQREPNPVSINYLNQINVNVKEDVVAVVATHWDDDHIKGFNQTIMECESAKIAISAVLSAKELDAQSTQIDKSMKKSKFGSGITELRNCLETIDNEKRRLLMVTNNKAIITENELKLEHQKKVEIFALSPSDYQCNEFINELTSNYKNNTDSRNTTKVKGKMFFKNNLSVAMLVKIGNFSILLGADVEECNSIDYGWKPIVQNLKGISPQPHIYKVAHHGSALSHSNELWSDILKEKPTSVVTPFTRSSGIPTDTDINRIKRLSSNAYTTGTKADSSKVIYDQEIMEFLSNEQYNILPKFSGFGTVIITLDVNSGNIKDIKLKGSAKKL